MISRFLGASSFTHRLETGVTKSSTFSWSIDSAMGKRHPDLSSIETIVQHFVLEGMMAILGGGIAGLNQAPIDGKVERSTVWNPS